MIFLWPSGAKGVREIGSEPPIYNSKIRNDMGGRWTRWGRGYGPKKIHEVIQLRY